MFHVDLIRFIISPLNFAEAFGDIFVLIVAGENFGIVLFGSRSIFGFFGESCQVVTAFLEGNRMIGGVQLVSARLIACTL